MNENHDSTLSVGNGQMYLHQGSSGDITSSYGVIVIEDPEKLNELINWLSEARNYMIRKRAGDFDNGPVL